MTRETTRRREEADELATLLARSRRKLWSNASRRMETQGESMLVWQLLHRLRCDGAMTQVDLAFRTGQHPAGVSRLLDTLEQLGQVQRERDPDDRRKMRVDLTRPGRDRLRAADPVVTGAADEVFTPLSPAERRSLKALLVKLLGTDAPARRK